MAYQAKVTFHKKKGHKSKTLHNHASFYINMEGFLYLSSYDVISLRGFHIMGSYKYEFETGLNSTPAVEFWNLGVEFSNSNLLNSTPKFHNSTAGVEISPVSNSYLYDPIVAI